MIVVTIDLTFWVMKLWSGVLTAMIRVDTLR